MHNIVYHSIQDVQCIAGLSAVRLMFSRLGLTSLLSAAGIAALLLLLTDDCPAHTFSKPVTLQTLHGYVGIIFVVVVYLLAGRYPIETVRTIAYYRGSYNCIVWDNARFVHINLPSLVKSKT